MANNVVVAVENSSPDARLARWSVEKNNLDHIRSQHTGPVFVVSEYDAPDAKETLARILLKIGQACENQDALELLSDLCEKGVLNLSHLGETVPVGKALAIGILAGGDLCDADDTSLRATSRGIRLVETLLSSG